MSGTISIVGKRNYAPLTRAYVRIIGTYHFVVSLKFADLLIKKYAYSNSMSLLFNVGKRRIRVQNYGFFLTYANYSAFFWL